VPAAASGARAARLPRDLDPGRFPARRLGLSAPAPRLGVSLGLWQDRDPLEALATARVADELGFPELWVGEMATWDAFALAGAIARDTRSIELCVGPLATAVRDPMAMAMGVASVAALGGRPAHLAIGSSSRLVVERWHGRRRERTARHLRESAQALRPLLAGEKARYEGELVRTEGYRLRLAAPGATLTVAAFGDAAVLVAARHADRMVLNLVTPELVARMAQRLRAETDTPPRLAAWVVAAVDPAPEAHAQLARGLVPYLGAEGYSDMFAAAGFGDLVEAARAGVHPAELLGQVPPELAASVGLVGTQAEARARADEYFDAGLDELVFVPATAGDDAGARSLEALRDLTPCG
jgi:probable F420-dependent oxidoreductase